MDRAFNETNFCLCILLGYLKWLLLVVDVPDVPLKIGADRERPLAVLAFVGLLSSVRPQMAGEVGRPRKHFTAKFTGILGFIRWRSGIVVGWGWPRRPSGGRSYQRSRPCQRRDAVLGTSWHLLRSMPRDSFLRYCCWLWSSLAAIFVYMSRDSGLL